MSEEELLSLGRDEQRSLYFNNESYQCALLSCGGAIETCAAVMDRVVKNAIAVIRPPGHHAEPSQAMGFCLFNNVAVAIKVMQRRYGDACKRVMILDWYTTISTALKVGMYITETAPKQLSNQIQMFYIFHFIGLVSILRTRQQKVAGIAAKDLDLESNTLDAPKLILGM
jgi:hypothetical protein